MRKTVAGLAAAAVLLTGCGADAAQDRSSGKSPDKVVDATEVTVYLNADKVPNVAFFCTGPFRWYAMLNSETDRSTVLERFPEGDSECQKS